MATNNKPNNTNNKRISAVLEKQITRAWQRQDKWLYLLSPLSGVYAGVSGIKKQLYHRQLLSSYRAKVPVMIVGNITVGGAGKTPLIIALVKHLRAKGVHVGVISRGYGGDYKKMPAIVTLDSTPDVVGDEPCLLVRATQMQAVKQTSGLIASSTLPMAVCPNRQAAIECLLTAYPNVQLIIADDGLQHYQLQRDIEWVVVDSQRGFGNGWLLPVGFLREPVSRLQNTTVIYNQTNDKAARQEATQPPCYKNTHQNTHPSMWLKPDKLQPLLSWLNKDVELDELALSCQLPKKGDTVYAVSGIGYPKRFFDTLRRLGYQVIEHPYPDHHHYCVADLLTIAAASSAQAVVMTSKDAVKIQHLFNQQPNQQEFNQQYLEQNIEQTASLTQAPLNQLLSRLFVLPVTAQLNASCIQQLEKQLQAFGVVVN